MVINDGYGQLASWYYNHFSIEPISAKETLAAEKPSTIPKTSLQTLLEVLLKFTPNTDVIIVAHGFDHGMVMPIVPGSRSAAKTEALSRLMEGDTKKLVGTYGLSENTVQDLLAKAEAVRKIGLGHIAFRGCSIGSNKRNLQVLRDFLGAKDASAASVLSTYGYARPDVVSAGKFDQAWKNYSGKAHRFEGSNGKLIFWRAPHPREQYADVTKLMVTDKKVLHEWFQAVFDPKTSGATATKHANKTPLHYLVYEPPVMPLDGVGNPTALGYLDFISRASDP